MDSDKTIYKQTQEGHRTRHPTPPHRLVHKTQTLILIMQITKLTNTYSMTMTPSKLKTTHPIFVSHESPNQ